jgi:flagellar biosynthesis/type III secretory pathway chaperone
VASLIEDFIDTLDKEDSEYKKLLEISVRKTPILVKGDVQALAAITDEEQKVVDRIGNLDRHRTEVLGDIATVLNKDVQTLKIPRILELLERQPKEREALSEVYERLKVTVGDMKRINERNHSLIRLSLDMVQFDINLMQAAKHGPETGDYNSRGAYSSQVSAGEYSRFDSKS